MWKNSNIFVWKLDELDLQLDTKWGKTLALHNKTNFLKFL